jgi:thymidylate synthase (FAD)
MMHLWIIESVERKFLQKGKVIIQKLIKGENVDVDSSGLSKREWNELMIAFDLKDKLI